MLTLQASREQCPRDLLLDWELLWCEVLQRSRAWLLAHCEYAPTSEQWQAFQGYWRRRLGGEPVAYILGRKEFWSLELRVDENVLIPRPESELLVELCLRLLPDEDGIKVIDLGCGSGAIALALASERPRWQLTATDISPAALAVARANGRQLGLEVRWVEGDWLRGFGFRDGGFGGVGFGGGFEDGCGDRDGCGDGFGGSCGGGRYEKYDAIVANPPYLAADDPHLARLGYEPRGALVAGVAGGLGLFGGVGVAGGVGGDGIAMAGGVARGMGEGGMGEEGMGDLREIICQSRDYLVPGGLLALEHGCGQGAAVRGELGRGGYAGVQTELDWAGLERVSWGWWGDRW